MGLALYRKYRPASFAEVRGQDHVTVPLRRALASGRLHHAYLFSGPRGCGKTSSARILARSLNCEQGPTPDPCGSCDSCVALAPNGPGSLDVVEIDAASHGGVDDARDLRERAFYAPVSSRFKVYIIDEAHMVSREGFNALLKLVEEPPEFLRFVFATTEPEKVIATIRSRTHHYPFRLMPRAELAGLLTDIAASEGVAVDPEVLPLVVRAAAGSARDGLSILDQVMASAGPEGVTREGAAALLGVTPDALLDDVVDAFAARDAASVFRVLDQVMEGGHDPRRFAQDVLERLRDLLVLDAVPDAGTSGLVEVPPDRLDRIARQASALGSAGLSRAADLFAAGLTEMRGTTAPRLQLELVCARVLLPGAGTDEAALIARLERLERRIDVGAVAAPAAPAAPPAVPPHVAPEPAAPAATAGPAAPAPTPSAPAMPAPTAPAPAAPAPAAPASTPPAPAPSRAPTPAAPATAPVAASRPPAAPSPAAAAAGQAAGGAARPAAGRAAPDRAAGEAWPVAAALGGVPAEAAPDGPPDPAAAAPGGLDAAALRRAWDAVLDQVKTRKRTTLAQLQTAQVRSVEGRRLVLAFAHAPVMRAFQGGVGVDVLKESLQAALGADLDVTCVVADEAAPAASSPEGAPSPAPPAYEGFAPGDEPEPDDPDAPPAAPPRADEDALALVQRELGGQVLRTGD